MKDTTVRLGPGHVYWAAAGQPQPAWVYLGETECPTCQGTGYDPAGLACPFGCQPGGQPCE